MPVHKRKYASGKTVWFFQFDAPGSTATNRILIKESGFNTKSEATDAEAIRRVEEQKKHELHRANSGSAPPLPTTLKMLLEEFLRQHADEKLAPKTVERYRQQAVYLDPGLLAMELGKITPLHLSREWDRLLKCGGHTRRHKTPRPLSRKSVRNIAGMVSSAFSRGMKWGLVAANPVPSSEPPVAKKRKGIALTSAQQELLVDTASGPWCLPAFLELSAATGARRGELLALRWSDIQDGRAIITRSLTQTKQILKFKDTKTEDSVRTLKIPTSALAMLSDHRKRQDEFRHQFGSDYRADLDLVFGNPDGTPLRPDSVSASVSALCRRLKLPKGVSLHSLRHTHGSHMLANGVPLPVVSERLGHSSVRVTADVYSHAIHGQDDEAALKWEEFQRRGSSSTKHAHNVV
jgi:integrase